MEFFNLLTTFPHQEQEKSERNQHAKFQLNRQNGCRDKQMERYAKRTLRKGEVFAYCLELAWLCRQGAAHNAVEMM